MKLKSTNNMLSIIAANILGVEFWVFSTFLLTCINLSFIIAPWKHFDKETEEQKIKMISIK